MYNDCFLLAEHSFHTQNFLTPYIIRQIGYLDNEQIRVNSLSHFDILNTSYVHYIWYHIRCRLFYYICHDDFLFFTTSFGEAWIIVFPPLFPANLIFERYDAACANVSCIVFRISTRFFRNFSNPVSIITQVFDMIDLGHGEHLPFRRYLWWFLDKG